MPAKDVVAMLPTMPKELLVKVREYEVNNKGRVTVMREIDAMLESVSETAENSCCLIWVLLSPSWCGLNRL